MTEDYEWPCCCELGCSARANTVHVRPSWQYGERPKQESAGIFYCPRHGTECDWYWMPIVSEPPVSYSFLEHLEGKRWGPAFLDWLAKEHPTVFLARC